MAVNGIEITGVNITPVKNYSEKNRIEAFVRVTLNESFVVSGVKIIQGRNGPYVAFPQKYIIKNKQHYDICYPLTEGLRKYFNELICAEYEKA